jgi:hypothetical protein
MNMPMSLQNQTRQRKNLQTDSYCEQMLLSRFQSGKENAKEQPNTPQYLLATPTYIALDFFSLG